MKLSRFLFAALMGPIALQAVAHAQSVQPPSFSGASVLLNNVGDKNQGGKVGTVQYSASTGSSSNFAVGTSTGLGVNASASSTSDYSVTSTARMNVDGSLMKQSIGTSGIADTAAASGTLASQFAQSKVSETYGSDWSAYQAMSSSDKAKNSSGSAYATQTEYDLARSSAVTTQTASYSNSRSFQDAKNGVISGSFTQAADAGQIVKTTDVLSLDSSDKALVGNTAKASSGVTDRTIETTNQSKGSTASNQVTVAGIGNAANIQSTAGSNFTSTVQARKPSDPGLSNSATANGSAGASLNSSATANSSATSFVSTFLQSF